MNLKNAVKTHTVSIKEDVYVEIAGIEFSLRDLMDINCPNFVAAKRLSKMLKKLGVKSIAQLWKLDPFSLFNTRGVGMTQVYVAMCVVHTKYSGLKWIDRFAPKKREKQDV